MIRHNIDPSRHTPLFRMQEILLGIQWMSLELDYFLGLKISQDSLGIKISQAKYSRDIMEIFHMTDCKYAPTSFFFGVRLKDCKEIPLVENTLCIQLVGIFLYLSHT
jgi:hypothetical protein